MTLYTLRWSHNKLSLYFCNTNFSVIHKMQKILPLIFLLVLKIFKSYFCILEIRPYLSFASMWKWKAELYGYPWVTYYFPLLNTSIVSPVGTRHKKSSNMQFCYVLRHISDTNRYHGFTAKINNQHSNRILLQRIFSLSFLVIMKMSAVLCTLFNEVIIFI